MCAYFDHVSGESSSLTWIWDPAQQDYELRVDLSEFPADDGDIGDYTGLWEFVGKNTWLKIYDDETCEFVNDQEDVVDSGYGWTNATGITLRFYDGSDMLMLYRAENGNLISSGNDAVFVPVDSIN